MHVIKPLLYLTAFLPAPLVGLHAAQPTPAEHAAAAQWAQTHLQTDRQNVPFSFVLAGKAWNDLPGTWRKHQETRELDAQCLEHTRTWRDDASGLHVRLVAVEYADFPVVEWTVWLKNTGKDNTALLENIRGLDAGFERTVGGEYVLHGIRGDSCVAESFRPFAHTLGPDAVKWFSPPVAGDKVSGKSSDGPDGWPYWNLQRPGGKSGGRQMTGLHVEKQASALCLATLVVAVGSEILLARTPFAPLFDHPLQEQRMKRTLDHGVGALAGLGPGGGRRGKRRRKTDPGAGPGCQDGGAGGQHRFWRGARLDGRRRWVPGLHPDARETPGQMESGRRAGDLSQGEIDMRIHRTTGVLVIAAAALLDAFHQDSDAQDGAAMQALLRPYLDDAYAPSEGPDTDKAFIREYTRRIGGALPDKLAVEPTKKRRVLVVTQKTIGALHVPAPQGF